MRTTFWGTSAPAAAPHSLTTSASEIQLVVEPLAQTQWRVCDNRWRVCDNRWAELDPRHLLGFIEVTADSEFEVMTLAGGFEWFTYATFDDATAHFLHLEHEPAPVSTHSHVVFSAATTPLIE